MEIIKKINVLSFMLLFAAIILDVFIWSGIVAENHGSTREYFFGGKEPGALLILRGGAVILLGNSMPSILKDAASRVDLVILRGENDGIVAENIGAAAYSGRGEIHAKAGIPIITLGAGDTIDSGGTTMEILSPDDSFVHSPDNADASIVMSIETGISKTLFTAESSAAAKEYLSEGNRELRWDIIEADPTSGIARDQSKILIIQNGTAADVRSAAFTTQASAFYTDTRSVVEIDESGKSLKVKTLNDS